MERRMLQIVVYVLTKSFPKVKLKCFGRIPEIEKANDALTKKMIKRNAAIWRLMNDHVLRIAAIRSYE